MKTTRLTPNTFSLANPFILGITLAVISSIPATAQADNFEPWSSVASAGTVDEADTGIVTFSGATAGVATSAAVPATLDIRYNLVAVDGLLQSGDGTFFEARLRDNGANARVILRLRQINLATGAVSTVLSIDSNTLPALPNKAWP
jgi:hypothetical protein